METVAGNRIIAEFMEIETRVYSDTPTITRWRYGNSMIFNTDLQKSRASVLCKTKT